MKKTRKGRTLRHAPLAAAVAALSTVFSLSLVASPCRAWYGAGHEVVALLAYQDMKPETRAKVDAILRAHPDYAKWLTELPTGVKPEDQGKYIFAIAATWPDRIKSPNDESVTIKFTNVSRRNAPAQPLSTDPHYPDLIVHGDWHYVDFPINADGKERPSPPTDDSALIELPVCETRLSQPGIPASWRAYYMAWVEHLVGDLHQPLHCCSRYSAKYPTGDQGGNLVHFASASRAEPRNLHSYWDGLLGDSTDWTALEKTAADIHSKESNLLAGFDPAVRDSDDISVWCAEGVALDQNTVYTFGPAGPDADGDLPQPDAGYHARALAIALQRGALAGHRLARVLDDALKG